MKGGEGPHLVANAAFLAEKTAKEAAEGKLTTLRRAVAHKDDLLKTLKTKVHMLLVQSMLHSQHACNFSQICLKAGCYIRNATAGQPIRLPVSYKQACGRHAGHKTGADAESTFTASTAAVVRIFRVIATRVV